MAERQVRKIVTILFADVVGSTTLGEELDPETTRAVMRRYFEAMRGAIERHGGSVEKFVGDAVMAVFGIPVVHEDDALRAVRAAADMRVALAALNQELLADRAISLQVRTGINTGEVVAGDPASGETFVTGDPVNVAARLEQAAGPGETLVGERTYRLVRKAVEVGPALAIEARGKSQPIRAYRLLNAPELVAAGGSSFETAFIGRRRELGRLEQAFESAVETNRCELFTLLGQAGVGKSRLLSEFLTGLGDRARIIRGRCLPYGDGITYWPLAEALRGAAGIADGDTHDEARAKLESIIGAGEDGLVGARLASSIGLSSETAPRAEIFWAIRKLMERLGRERPLVAVFEDIHWAEPTFLDALEDLADVSRGVPILVICPARSELLEARPGWGGGKLNATTMLLEPLPLDEAGSLIDAIPGGSALPASLRARITDAAEGNPLFVQEMIGMLVDDGILRSDGDGWVVDRPVDRVSVPPNIQALLAARLDQLVADERTVAGRASVVGRVFEQAAVTELAPEGLRPAVADALVALVRKELIVPDRAQLTAGDAFKFRHILIRDAAYESLPKAERADLHEQFASWIERVALERVGEYEEILGYHLEEAHRYRVTLGMNDERTASIAERAGHWLASAGKGAMSREDARAATSLLMRATALLVEQDDQYWQVMLALADAKLHANDRAAAAEIVHRVVEATRETNPVLAADARLLELWTRRWARPMTVAETRAEVAAILRTLRTGHANARQRAEGWQLVGEAEQDVGDVRTAERCYRRSAWLAGRAGDDRTQVDSELNLVGLGARSMMPVSEVRALCELTLQRAGGGRRPWGLDTLAYLAAMEGRFNEARASIAEARRIRDDLGVDAPFAEVTAGLVEVMAGDLAAAEGHFRSVAEAYERIGQSADVPFALSRLAQVIFRQGRDDEAMALVERALAEGDDAYVRVLAGGTRARILARRGNVEEGVAAARSVVARAADEGLQALPFLYGSALEDLAEVLLDAGANAEAAAALAEVATIYERKGIVVFTERVRARLAEIRVSEPA